MLAGPAIHSHLGNIMPPLLLEASEPDTSDPRSKAATNALQKVSAAVAEEGVYLLLGQLEKGLEEPSRRLAAANTVKLFCESSKLDFQEHVPSLITVCCSLKCVHDAHKAPPVAG